MSVLSVVTGTVPEERVPALRAAYDALLAGAFPDGLVETSLCRGDGGEWAVVTRWRDRAAIDAMRSTGATPAAVTLLQDAGAQPRVALYDVTATGAP